MAGAHEHLEQPEPRHRPRAAAQDAGPAAGRAAGPAERRLVHAPVPGVDLLHLQRSAGNAAVSALVAPPVQREVSIDEVETTVDSAPPGEAGTGPGAGAVQSDGGTTTITGGVINLEAAVTQTDGIIRAGTIVVDNVVASSYTPGAGNQW